MIYWHQGLYDIPAKTYLNEHYRNIFILMRQIVLLGVQKILNQIDNNKNGSLSSIYFLLTTMEAIKIHP